MRSRLLLALVSLGLGTLLPLAIGTVALRISEASACEELDCLGVFLLALAAGLPVAWVVWSALLRVTGQRLAVLVPPLAAATTWLVPNALGRVLDLVVPLPGASALGLQVGMLALSGAAWSAVLGARPRKAVGYGP